MEVSYINIYKTTTGDSQLEVNLPALQKGEEDHSLTDGEEIMACVKILQMLEDLDNGQALVITRELF
jgi:hypothetical protein